MTASDLTFGIEIETHVPAGSVRVGSWSCPNHVAGLPGGWVAKPDSSIRPPTRASSRIRPRQGCEFVSPVLQGADGIQQVMAAVAHLNVLGAAVNASCGLHVHIGWDGDEKALARLVTLVANFERGIYAATGTHGRENGTWSRGLQRYGNDRDASENSHRNRYHLLNLNNLATGRRRTVEFRAFAGTLNIVKIIGYIRLCLALVERAMKTNRKTNWTAKRPVASSPIARNGEGQTELTRLFYQIGWTHGRTSHTFGDVSAEGAPDHKTIKRHLMRLAKKYDRES